jgi:hypothetical protein
MASAELREWDSRTIELAGRICRISVDEPAWLAHLDRACGRYQVTTPSPAAQLYMAGRAERLPAEARALLALPGMETDIDRPWVAQVTQVGGKTVSVESRKLLVIAAELGVCLVRQPISSMASFYYNYLHPLLIEWLARSGVLYVHAGAVEHALTGPLLVAGPRHAGKTTTCLALLGAGGCRFLSDDTVLIDERGHLHTLLRPMHPERRLCEAWSSRLGLDLEQLEPLADGRVDLDPGRWFAERVVDRLDPPRALILPWADGSVTTRCEPVGPEQAAAVLLAQVHAGVPPVARDMLARVSDLIALPALRLHVGRDAFTDPELLWDRLRRGLEDLDR